MKIMLIPRSDGLLEPMTERGIEAVKAMDKKPNAADFQTSTRSSLQNQYLNGWVYPQLVNALNAGGYVQNGKTFTRDRLHAIFQFKFLVKEEIETKGGLVYLFQSTAKMSKKRFCEYIDEQIRPFMINDFQIDIPDPRMGDWAEAYRLINK